MAYDKLLAERVRISLAGIPNIEEKEMFKGISFLVNDKMCINVSGNELMVRFDPAMEEEILAKPGCRQMVMKDRVYKGYAYVSQEFLQEKDQLDFWVKLCLDFNQKAKSSKKKKS